jgi:integrase/recombinase XerD
VGAETTRSYFCLRDSVCAGAKSSRSNLTTFVGGLEIFVRGKGRMVDHLPLLSDVGEALALYIREDRGVSASRRVFLRIWAPRIGLTGPAAVGHIVRRALAQAGVYRSGRGAFRHGLATKMIRHGASISEIAEVLRHRSQNTTAIYAQVSFEALREVALPWPTTGGAR